MPEINLIPSDSIPADLVSLIADAPLPGLAEGPRCGTTRSAVEQWRTSGSSHAGTLIESALWLLAGELDRSHTISQSYESSDGSFWHGIMHRREGDYGNSKYWFRRVGNGHEVHRRLVTIVEEHANELGALPLDSITDANTIAESLVDLSQAAVRGHTDYESELRRVCWWEWQLLFERSLI